MAENNDKRGVMMVNLEKQQLCDGNTYGALKRDPEKNAENPLNLSRKELLEKAWKRLVFACVLCTIVLVAEIIGSALSGSLAVLADAGHLFTDVVTYIISLTSIKLSRKPTSKKFTFGWLRAEVLGALFSIILSIGLAIILSYFAIMRIINKDFELDGLVMLIIGVINFLANVIQIFQLQCGTCCCKSEADNQEEQLILQQLHGHSHGGGGGGHGHSHGGKDGDDTVNDHMNVRAACLHILGDAIFGFGLLVGALIIYFKPELKIVDPILTIIFGVIVLGTMLSLFRDTLNVLMEGKPRSIDYDDVRRRLVEIDGVEGVHSLRIWALTSDVHLASGHLVLARLYDGRPVDASKILQDARHVMETHFHILHSTIQIETAEDGVTYLCARSAGPA